MASQEALAAAAAAHYQGGGEEDVYPAGAHAIGHSGVHGEGAEGAQAEGAPQMVKRTSDWVQEGEEEQDEAKKARIDGDPGAQLSCLYCFWPWWKEQLQEMKGKGII